MGADGSPRVLLYFEDPPTRDGVVSAGLSRVNRHVVSALGGAFAGGICISTSIRRPLHDDDLQPEFREKALWGFRLRLAPDSLLPAILKFTGRAFSLPSRAVKGLQQQLMGRGDLLLATIGTDIGALSRALAVAKSLGVPVVAYLVDDATANSVIARKPINAGDERDFQRALLECKAVFCITKGLAEATEARYGVRTTFVNLPFVAPPVSPVGARTNQIVFIGSTSHFYQDGLAECAESVANLRRKGFNISLTFTMKSPFAAGLAQAFGPDSIEFQPCGTDEDLRKLLAQAAACFMPYSFHERFRQMVKSSFPSKMTEYLAAASHIITYAPAYATSTLSMKDSNLDTVITEHSRTRLEGAIEKAVNYRKDFSASYRSALHHEHNPARFAQQVFAAAA